ncbi:UNVERIFIED_ORG: DNA-binding LacI/PurR family transcriptional regulator [Microbispora rosea subsp. rosea]
MHHALAQASPAVPKDFSIAGVAAQHLAENLDPPLTSTDVPAIELGAGAVELLIQRIADPGSPHRHLLAAPPISLRGTTGPAKPRAYPIGS